MVRSAPISATNHTNDFFRIVDLNPPTPNPEPVASPRDPRGLCMFGFVAQGQRIALIPSDNLPSGLRVLFSFDYDYAGGIGAPASTERPHGFLQAGGAYEQTYAALHDRTSVTLWIDPTGAKPTPGQVIEVSVTAWRQD